MGRSKQTKQSTNHFGGKGPTAKYEGRPGRTSSHLYDKIKSRKKYFKDKETLIKEQEDHRGTSTSQDQTANSNLPSSRRAPLQIPCCLETAGSRSMDNGSNYTRLPTRILQDSSHEIDLPDFIPLAGVSGSVGPRSA